MKCIHIICKLEGLGYFEHGNIMILRMFRVRVRIEIRMDYNISLLFPFGKEFDHFGIEEFPAGDPENKSILSLHVVQPAEGTPGGRDYPGGGVQGASATMGFFQTLEIIANDVFTFPWLWPESSPIVDKADGDIPWELIGICFSSTNHTHCCAFTALWWPVAHLAAAFFVYSNEKSVIMSIRSKKEGTYSLGICPR